MMTTPDADLSGSPTGKQRYHAFLSHNGAEKSLVEQLAYELEKRGLSCWLDRWNLIPGDPWQPVIEEALSNCDTCVIFFGPHGIGPWHNEEMRLAIQRRVGAPERKLRVLPVILPGGQRAKESDVPGFLQGTTWVKFEKSIEEEDAVHRLECGIKGIAPGHRPGVTIAEGECPYLGLKTFQPDDAALFFGRTAKIQELIDRLRDGFGTPREDRLLALIGASGSGKSSLALAGLIPAIKRSELPESAAWPLVRCRPGARPWESLQVALAAHERIAPHFAALPALIARPEDEQRRLHLTARLALQSAPETHRLFVLIDQFEEIFTLCKDEEARRPLIDNLLYATSVVEGRTIVVLTMRADFYGQCASYPGLRASISDHQLLIGPLSEEELREVIENPAQMAGGELEPGLMELLLSDMEGQPGALPFLGDALFKLWENRDGRRLTAKAYMNMGRLAGALDTHAEEFFTKELTPEEQALCHQLLVDLVHPGEGAADTKKRVAMDDVASTDAARAVLKKLADARLVTTTGEPGAAQAELAHEALISGWRRLGNWVNENREKSLLKERLLDAAREWQENGKGGDFLYRGSRLASAEESFGLSMQFLPQLARAFLETSVAERDRERKERQRQREEKERQQQRELENERARAKAEEERAEAEKQRAVEAEARRQAEEARANAERRYAEKQTRAALKMRRLAKILGVFSFLAVAAALLAIVAGVFAFLLKAEADKQKTYAQQQAQAAETSRSAAEDALRKSFERTIGVPSKDFLSPDQRVALWELSEIDNLKVRELLIDTWVHDPEHTVRALTHNSRGLHAAIGLNAEVREHFDSQTGKAADGVVAALKKKATDSDLLRLGEALATLAARMNPSDGAGPAAEGVSVLTEALKDPEETDSVRVRSLGDTLAALAARMDSKEATSVANRLAKELADPNETDPDRLSRLGYALAALSAHLSPNDATHAADRLAKLLWDPNETDPGRLSRLGYALAAFTVHTKEAAHMAPGATSILAKALETSKNSKQLWGLGKAISDLAARMDAKDNSKDAASVADGLTNALGNPNETDPDRLWSLRDALVALAPLIDAEDANHLIARVATALEGSNEANSEGLWCLGAVLASLATKMDPKDAVPVADRVAKALWDPKEKNSARKWGLGEALAALAARIKDPEDAASIASKVTKKISEFPEMDSDSLSGLGEALAALAANIDHNTGTGIAADGASVLADALENAKEKDSKSLQGLGSALAALAAQMDQNAASSVAKRGAKVLADRLKSETDSDLLSRLGSALAALAARCYSDSQTGSQTRLVALSNLLLASASPKRSQKEQDQDRKRIETTCKALSKTELVEVLKWPSCVGEAQKLVFEVLGQPSEGLMEFSEQVDSLGIDGVNRAFLDQPAKRPNAEDAVKELKQL